MYRVELSLPDLSKLIGDEWKKLSENQRAVSFGFRGIFRFNLRVADSDAELKSVHIFVKFILITLLVCAYD